MLNVLGSPDHERFQKLADCQSSSACPAQGRTTFLSESETKPHCGMPCCRVVGVATVASCHFKGCTPKKLVCCSMDMSNYPPNARENTTGARDGTILDLSEDIGSVNFIQGTSMAMPDGTLCQSKCLFLLRCCTIQGAISM